MMNQWQKVGSRMEGLTELKDWIKFCLSINYVWVIFRSLTKLVHLLIYFFFRFNDKNIWDQNKVSQFFKLISVQLSLNIELFNWMDYDNMIITIFNERNDYLIKQKSTMREREEKEKILRKDEVTDRGSFNTSSNFNCVKFWRVLRMYRSWKFLSDRVNYRQKKRKQVLFKCYFFNILIRIQSVVTNYHSWHSLNPGWTGLQMMWNGMSRE